MRTVVLIFTLCLLVEGSRIPASFGDEPREAETARAPHAIEAGGSSSKRRPITKTVFQAQILKWAKQVRNDIAPTFHWFETEHFLILSAWDPRWDSHLRSVTEEMFEKLCGVLQIEDPAEIWRAKVPIFVFASKDQFARFNKEVTPQVTQKVHPSEAKGYHATLPPFSYLVLNSVERPGQSQQEAVQRFYELLIHEGTHAFMSRYHGGRPLPAWVSEGFAEHVTALLIADSEAYRHSVQATRLALRSGIAPARLLREKTLSHREYGIAHSLVRFLIRTDSEAFRAFIQRLKEGVPSSKALRDAYGADPDQVLRAWSRHALTEVP